MTEEGIGRVTHYFGQIGVAAISVEKGSLGVGDRIHIRGATSDFVQPVTSLEINHRAVDRVGSGEVVALKTIRTARRSDRVYKIIEED